MSEARLHSINVSDGGVPKLPRETCLVRRGGLEGDRRSARISQKVHPGWSRLYARVLKEGTLRVGDGVRILQSPNTGANYG